MVLVLGNTLFGKRIVKELKKKNINVLLTSSRLRDLQFRRKIESHKIIHYIGSPSVTFLGFLTLLRFRFWRKKIIVSWIGSDVMIANNSILWRIISKFSQKMIDLNITDDEYLVKELLSINIKAKVQKLPIYSIFSIRELPKRKKVVVYLPDMNEHYWGFYRGGIIKKLVNELPNIEFVIVRNSGARFTEKNVSCIAWTDNMEKIYQESSVVIRLPIHDASGATIIEALSMGRTVISSYDFPYCIIASEYKQVERQLKLSLEKPKLNEEGSRYIHKNFNNSSFTESLIEIYKSLENK